MLCYHKCPLLGFPGKEKRTSKRGGSDRLRSATLGEWARIRWTYSELQLHESPLTVFHGRPPLSSGDWWEVDGRRDGRSSGSDPPTPGARPHQSSSSPSVAPTAPQRLLAGIRWTAWRTPRRIRASGASRRLSKVEKAHERRLKIKKGRARKKGRETD